MKNINRIKIIIYDLYTFILNIEFQVIHIGSTNNYY